jgi:hypothetical protein
MWPPNTKFIVLPICFEKPMATQNINSTSEILENQGILYKVIRSGTK